MENNKLIRRIGFPLLTFYGLGTILGAGIYVLVGKVATQAGLLTPLAFLVAAGVAAITAFSYIQLVITFPKSAGEAYYVEKSFTRPWYSIVVGYLVIFVGVISAATLANGFVGYLSVFLDISHQGAIIFIVLLLGGIALWGIAESLWIAAIITLVEIGGLLLVIYFAGDALSTLPEKWDSVLIPEAGIEWSMVIAGAFLAFYAFIGFEDMVNVVEEVKDPQKTMPRAILSALIISSILYVLVALVAILGMPLDELSASSSPLQALLTIDHPKAGIWISVISLFAILNGVLTQIIMASRVLYGMAEQGRAPIAFAGVSALTHTPWLATFSIVILILIFSLWLPLVVLAKTTSFIILIIFSIVNLALWKLNKMGKIPEDKRLPAWPLLGAILCVGLLLFQIFNVLTFI